MDTSIEEEYINVVEFPSGRKAGLMSLMYTWAIIADITWFGYENRWCYSTLTDAQGALDDWNGEGEPQGWHRHLPSGRRRDKDGNDIGAW